MSTTRKKSGSARALFFVLISIVLVGVIAGCFEPIVQDILILVADDYPPSLTIDSPQFNQYYTSTMSVVGNVIDSSRTDGDGEGKLKSIELTFLEASQFDRTVEFTTEGTVEALDPILDVPFFTYDPESGDFSLEFSTVGLEGDQYLTITAVDQNGNFEFEEITLKDPGSGPLISILTPSQNSNFLSTVTVTGRVLNQGGSDQSATEVATLTYTVPNLSIIESPIDFSAEDGSFSFPFDTSGYSGNLSITVEGVDLNSRASSQTLVLLGDSIGPTLSISSPVSGTFYQSSVTVTGVVRDKTSLAASPTIDELDTLEYRIGGGTLVTVPGTDIDAATGDYTFTFTTVGLSGTVTVQVMATDKNGRVTNQSIELLTYSSGPSISISAPTQNSDYQSTVTVSGVVSDQDSGGTAFAEVDTLRFAVNALSLDLPVVFDPADGTFTFSFDTSGFHVNLAVVLTATDLNGRISTSTLNLLGDLIGPEVSITSPLDNSYYQSSVTVAGLVRDRDSSAASPTIDELDIMEYQVGSLPPVSIPVAGVDPVTGAYSLTFSTVGLSGTLALRVRAVDKNDRDTETSIDLLSFSNGPVVTIDSPIANSSYSSTILVSGSVADQDSGGATSNSEFSGMTRSF